MRKAALSCWEELNVGETPESREEGPGGRETRDMDKKVMTVTSKLELLCLVSLISLLFFLNVPPCTLVMKHSSTLLTKQKQNSTYYRAS